MVGVAPAIGLGLLVIFFLGYWVTYVIFEPRTKLKDEHPPMNVVALKQLEQNYLTEDEVKIRAFVGGGIAVVLLLIVMFNNKELGSILLVVLTVLGILFGVSTFFIFGSKTTPSTKPGPASPPTPKPEAPHKHWKAPNTYHAQDSNNDQDIKIIIVCENCSQKLRIPKRDKDLVVTCPTCRHEFTYRYHDGT